MRYDKRQAARKAVSGLTISNLTALDQFALIARSAKIVDVSSLGLLLIIDRQDLVPKSLRQNLSLEAIEGEHVMFRISEMDLEIDGIVMRTKMIGRGFYEIAIDYSEEAPEYWRECLFDLLPQPGEFENAVMAEEEDEE